MVNDLGHGASGRAIVVFCVVLRWNVQIVTQAFFIHGPLPAQKDCDIHAGWISQDSHYSLYLGSFILQCIVLKQGGIDLDFKSIPQEIGKWTVLIGLDDHLL